MQIIMSNMLGTWHWLKNTPWAHSNKGDYDLTLIKKFKKNSLNPSRWMCQSAFNDKLLSLLLFIFNLTFLLLLRLSLLNLFFLCKLSPTEINIGMLIARRLVLVSLEFSCCCCSCCWYFFINTIILISYLSSQDQYSRVWRSNAMIQLVFI